MMLFFFLNCERVDVWWVFVVEERDESERRLAGDEAI